MVRVIRYCLQTICELLGGYLGIPAQFDDQQAQFLRQLKRACRRARSWPRVRWQLITDYRGDDPATSKLQNALEAFWGRSCDFNQIYVAPLDTAACGFAALVQLCAPLTHLPQWLVGFLNVAPIYKSDKRNGGHPYYAVLLKNGKVVFSPNAGHSLSFLRSYAVAFFELDFESAAVQPPNGKDVQFRSWWWFSQMAAEVLRGDLRHVVAVTAAADADFVPPVPDNAFHDWDNFGNGRTSLSQEEAAERGFRDGVVIDIVDDQATVVTNAVFGNNVHGIDGERTLSAKPGSNIVQAQPGADCVQFIDFFRVGASAQEICGHPTPTARVRLEISSEQPAAV